MFDKNMCIIKLPYANNTEDHITFELLGNMLNYDALIFYDADVQIW